MGLIAEKPQYASEAGHWYTIDGTPMYEIVGKNGKVRNTTLRDAREHNLVPSVTTIIRTAAAPALEAWKLEEVVKASLFFPRQKDESPQAYCARIRELSQQRGRDTADEGIKIHGAIEAHNHGRPYSSEYIAHVLAANEALAQNCGPQRWGSERSFAHPLGYGGKSDLWCADWVTDTKTKEFSQPSEVVTYDEHAMQLAAYRRGLAVPSARCGILFVSRTHPGIVAFREIDETQLQAGLDMFDCLLRYWQIKTGHRPCFHSQAA